MDFLHLDNPKPTRLPLIRQQCIEKELHLDRQNIQEIRAIALEEEATLAFCPISVQGSAVHESASEFVCLEEIWALKTMAHDAEFAAKIHVQSIVFSATTVNATGTMMAIVWADALHVGVIQFDLCSKRIVSICPVFPAPSEGEVTCCHVQYWKNDKAILISFSTQYFDAGGMARILSLEDGTVKWEIKEPPLALSPYHEQNVQLYLDEPNHRLYYWFLSDQKICALDLIDHRVVAEANCPLVSAIHKCEDTLLVGGDKGQVFRLSTGHLQLVQDALDAPAIYYPCVAMEYDPQSTHLVSIHPYCERLWELNDHPGSRWGDVVFSEKKANGWRPQILQPFEFNPYNRSDSNLLFRIMRRQTAPQVVWYMSSSHRAELLVLAPKFDKRVPAASVQPYRVDITDLWGQSLPKMDQHHTLNGLYIATNDAVYCAWL